MLTLWSKKCCLIVRDMSEESGQNELHEELTLEEKLLAPNIVRVKETLVYLVFNSNDPTVVAVVGGWGEGKTYFWRNNVVKDFPEKSIGYVSVFGAASLVEIRQRVIAEAILMSKAGKSTSVIDRWGFIDVIKNQAKEFLAKYQRKLVFPMGLFLKSWRGHYLSLVG